MALLLRHAWKLGFGLLAIALLTARGAAEPTVRAPLSPHSLAVAAPAGPTVVSCSALMSGVTKWDANGSPYILPWNDPTIPPTDTTRQPNCTGIDPSSHKTVGQDVELGPGATLTIDGQLGPVTILSHGAGILVAGGQINTINTNGTNFVSFDASADAASWDGITITTGGADAQGQPLQGTGQFAYTTIQHALNAIQIDSGATSLPSATTDPGGYGLVFTNGAIGPSYFDGIKATNTPVQLIGNGLGQLGTVNNIGSQGVTTTFDPTAANFPGSIVRALDVEGIVFGSSVPFGQSVCLPGEQCGGTIGNDAIQGNFTGHKNIRISGNKFFRAGSFGVDLENTDHPQLFNNQFVCNGSGSATPLISCTPTPPSANQPPPIKFSAIYLNEVKADVFATPVPPSAPNPGVSNNYGQENGLDAIVMNGTITNDLTWLTPTPDSDTNIATPGPQLGYMVANGDLEVQKSLTVRPDDVVKAMGGAIKLNNASLVVTGSAVSPAIFTSLRDSNNRAVDACGSVFAPNCPSPLPSNEWTGLSLVSGSSATIDHATILYASTGVSVVNGAQKTATIPSAPFGVVMMNSLVERTFGDGVFAENTPIDLEGNTFTCTQDVLCLGPVSAPCPQGFTCVGAATGDRGVLADFTGAVDSNGVAKALGSGLKLINNRFLNGTGSQGILGIGLSAQVVDIESNDVEEAGLSGIELRDSVAPTLLNNQVKNSGVSSSVATTSPAIWLNGLTDGEFTASATKCQPTDPLASSISGNSGSNNALNAIAFHGSNPQLQATACSFAWVSPAKNQSALGYLLDDAIRVKGDLHLGAGQYVPVLRGTIAIDGGKLDDNGATVTSLREQVTQLQSCGSIFVPGVTGAAVPCPKLPAAADYWGGFSLDPSFGNTVESGSTIQFAATALVVRPATASSAAITLQFNNSTIQHVTGDAIQTSTPLSVSQGTFNDIGGNGINQDLTALPPPASSLVLSVTSPAGTNTLFIGIGQAAVTSKGLDGRQAEVSDTRINSAGTYGIDLQSADDPASNGLLKVIGNDVTNSGNASRGQPTFPAIYVNGFRGPAVFLAGNTGGANGLNALAFHGTVTTSLVWTTPRQDAGPLGYLIDGNLTLIGDPLGISRSDLTVNAGDVVKLRGVLTLQGGAIHADDISSSTAKVFTSLTDDTAWPPVCHSILLTCSGSAGVGDWQGIVLDPVSQAIQGSGSDFVNAAIRYAVSGIKVSSGATSTTDSSAFGLTVSHTAIGPSQVDGINDLSTPLTVTDSNFINLPNAQAAQHGIFFDFSNAPSASLRISNSVFRYTQAEAVVGQQLLGSTLWITDNQVQHAGTFGFRLPDANAIIFRNNNISASGTGSVVYPAAYLPGVTASFESDVRGNVGQGNGINGIVFDGTLIGDLHWITPPDSSITTTQPLGYMVSGPLTIYGGLSLTGSNPVVKALGGPITINGGALDNSGATGTTIFSSVKDPIGSFVSCGSFLARCGGAEPGDWGGLVLMGSGASGSLDHSLIDYATTGVSIDSGTIIGGTPILTVKNSTIVNTKSDGINSVDTPLDVEGTYIGDPSLLGVALSPQPNIGGHGIIASFFSPPAKPLTLLTNHIAWTGRDGIAANGLAGNPVDIDGNTVSNAQTYGILLVGADHLRLTGNTVNTSGGPTASMRYPAYYLNGVKADFETVPAPFTVAANVGSGNGIDALVLHGEATKSMTWVTTASPTLGYMLDGPLTVDGDLTTNPGDVVKTLNGAITVTGNLNVKGTLDANGLPTTPLTTFTSMGDSSLPTKACDDGVFDSPFVQNTNGACPVGPGAWKGLNIGGSASLTNALIRYDDGLTVSGGSLTYHQGVMSSIQDNAIVVTGHPATVTDVLFDTVGKISIDLQNATGDLERNVFTNDGSPAIETNGGTMTTIECSRVTAGNVQADNNTPVTIEQNAFGSTVKVTAALGQDAENNYWGQPTGPSNSQLSGVTVSAYFKSPKPTATIKPIVGVTSTAQPVQPLNPTKADSYGSVGIGKAEATITFDWDMNTALPNLPSVSYDGATGSFTGAWQDDQTWIGTEAVNAPLTGSHSVLATGARSCVPYPQNVSDNVMTPASKLFVADTSTLPIVTVGTTDLVGSSSARLHVHVVPNGWRTGAGLVTLTNKANGADKQTYPFAALSSQTTPEDFTISASSLSPHAVYSYIVQVPSVNGTASQATQDTVTTTQLASELSFVSQPPSTVGSGAAFPASVSVTDGSRVVSDFSGSLTLTLSPSTATLSGTTTAFFVNGVASFGDLQIGAAGTYTLVATPSVGSISTLSSSSVTVQSTAGIKLAFTVSPPAKTTAGASLTPSIEVSVEDASNTLVAGDNATQVTLALTSSQGASLSGTTTVTVTGGVASFSNLSIDKKGTYTLTATSAPWLTSANSSSFTIIAGSATQLAFTQQPSDVQSTATIAPTVTVAIEDGNGNITNDTTTITVSLASNPAGGTLSGTLSRAAVAGVASFDDLSIDKVGSYTLGASGGGFTAPTSNSFNVVTGPAFELAFTVQPSSAASAGMALAQQPKVAVEDAGGNVVTSDSTTVVTLGIAGGNSGAKLACGTASVTLTSGVAAFSGCSIDTASLTAYQLTATSTQPILGPLPSSNVTVS